MYQSCSNQLLYHFYVLRLFYIQYPQALVLCWGNIHICEHDHAFQFQRIDNLFHILQPLLSLRANADLADVGTVVPLRLHLDLHGGTLDIRSEEGIGTTVTIRLPVPKAADNAASV